MHAAFRLVLLLCRGRMIGIIQVLLDVLLPEFQVSAHPVKADLLGLYNLVECRNGYPQLPRDLV